MTQQEQALEGTVLIVIDMIMKGVLKKNIIRFFNNKGFNGEMIDKVIRIAEIRAQELSHYKVGKCGKELGYAKGFKG